MWELDAELSDFFFFSFFLEHICLDYDYFNMLILLAYFIIKN